MPDVFIPYHFIRDHADLSWSEAWWGVRHGMIALLDSIDLARDCVFAGLDDPRALELAWLNRLYTYRAHELLQGLAEGEDEEDEEAMEEKWLYLELLWLFEHRDELDDPLGHVERVYADFGYPEEIEGFVRWMPNNDGFDPTNHGSEENVARMMGKWRLYLDQAKGRFGKRSNTI